MSPVITSLPKEVLCEYRRVAADLLDLVLDEAILPQQAVNRWPCPRGVDPSIDLAMVALLHFESDEDEQQADPYYLDAQLQWLDDIRQILSQGAPLSPHMLEMYHHELATSYYDDERALWEPVRSLFRSIWQRWSDASQAFRIWFD